MTKFIPSTKFSLSSTERLQLLWWFLIVAVSTIFFKFNYLDTIYRGGISIAVENYLGSAAWLEYMKVLCLMFVRSFAEVAVFLSLLYVIARRFMRINLNAVIVTSTLIVFLVGAANQLSLLNVRSLLSYDSLLVTIDWMSDNPDVINSYINKRNTAYIMLFVFLSLLPVVITNPRINSALFLRLNRPIFPVVTLLIVASLLLYFAIGLFVKANANLKPFDGYWTSVTSSFLGDNNSSLLDRNVPAVEVMKSDYIKLIYQVEDGVEKHGGSYVMPVNADKKHIVIISLETAPQKYYPIVNSPELKNFYRMSKSSIVTDMHFTSSPYTSKATYSMLTGMYVPPGGAAILYGKMSFNGLANILPEYGYTPTYIDSYYVDWHKGDAQQRVVNSYGFKNTFDRNDYDFKRESAKLSGEFDKALYAETVSFARIIESIDDAVAENKKSLIFVDTIMGHFKWKSRKGNGGLSNKEKIFKLANVFDELLGELLESLSDRNLEDDVIIVVTGDHGLRYREEYDSLGERDSNIMMGFNVPLMVYSSGLFDEQIALEQVTSHVDLTPTLLELVGVDTTQYFFHGANILSPALKQRTVFMMNQNLKPESSFYREGKFYTFNDLSGESYISEYRRNHKVSGSHDMVKTEDAELQQYTEKVIKDAGESFNDSAAYFLQRQKVSVDAATGK